MRRTFCFSLVAALLLITAHRVPAPIQEEATPAPKIREVSKPVSKPKPQPTAKPKAISSPLAGNWTGTINTMANDGGAGSYQHAITISPDGKISSTKWIMTTGNWSANFQSACEGGGNLLSWRFQAQGGGHVVTRSYIMQLNNERTATVTLHTVLTVGPVKGGTTDGTGVLIRR